MASNRAARLKKLAELARSKERMAGFELRRLKQALQEQDAQLDQLNGYRSEYSRRFRKVGESGLDVTQLRNYHLFFRGLNDAIDQQDSTIETYHEHLEEGEARWRHEYRKVNTLDKAVDRVEQTERNELIRRSQKLMDEAISSRKLRDSQD